MHLHRTPPATKNQLVAVPVALSPKSGIPPQLTVKADGGFRQTTDRPAADLPVHQAQDILPGQGDVLVEGHQLPQHRIDSAPVRCFNSVLRQERTWKVPSGAHRHPVRCVEILA